MKDDFLVLQNELKGMKGESLMVLMIEILVLLVVKKLIMIKLSTKNYIRK